ncbi:hypothetical protein KB976_004399 [Vibrio parahaemolyticus]|nr:hypothetical protein [Vibrio parahaemolyticus]
MKFDVAKNLRFIIMGGLSVVMLGWLGFDFLTNASQHPMPNALDVSQHAEENVDVTANFLSDTVQSVSEKTSELPSRQLPSRTFEEPTPTDDTADSAIFELSDRAEEVLTELESTYLSEVKQARIKAQIKEYDSQQTLNNYIAPPKPVKAEAPPLTHALISQIKVKSIVQSPTRITAWVEAEEGTARPVERGAWVGNAKVADITKDSVRFITDNGKSITKYVDTPTPTVEVQDEVKR